MALYVTLETQNNRPNVAKFFDDSDHSTFELDMNVFPWVQLLQDVPDGLITLRNKDITYVIIAANVVQIVSNTYSNPTVQTVWQDLIALVFQNRVVLSEEEIVALLANGPIGNVSSSGSIKAKSLILGYRAITATYAMQATDYTVDCTTGTFTVTLIDATTCTGQIFNVINSGSGSITLATTGGQTIGNSGSAPTSTTIGSGSNVAVQSTGSGWRTL